MPIIDGEPLALSLAVMLFLAAAAAIGLFGVLMTTVAQRLAAKTGLGEALMGTVFVGASTSLPGIITSMVAAGAGHAELAVSNALGGIAAQTFFLAVADMAYRKANLEHAAASAENLGMGAFLITLLTVPLLALATPDLHIRGVHPLSLAAIVIYIGGIRLLVQARFAPMWYPRRTRETRVEGSKNDEAPRSGESDLKLSALWLRFAGYAVVVGAAGWLLAHAGVSIAEQTGISESIVGGLFTAVSSSLPELVIAVSAVRMGALTLAVGDIIGGNAFDTLFIAFSDFAYREGTIYAALSNRELFWLALVILMTSILLLGLIHRERHGFANIGLESVLVSACYIGALVALPFMG